jgi:hypothetical protein
MQHPFWFMKPVHLFLRFIGIERIILGSTGHHGQEAADELVTCLRKGCSTVLLPDGPIKSLLLCSRRGFSISHCRATYPSCRCSFRSQGSSRQIPGIEKKCRCRSLQLPCDSKCLFRQVGATLTERLPRLRRHWGEKGKRTYCQLSDFSFEAGAPQRFLHPNTRGDSTQLKQGCQEMIPGTAPDCCSAGLHASSLFIAE